MTTSKPTRQRPLRKGLLLAAAVLLSPGPAEAVAPPASEDPAGAALYDLVLHRPEELLHALEGAFAKLLGDPEEIEVHVEYRRTSELLGGRFRKVAVAFQDGALDLLKVRRARLEAWDVSYDLEALLSGETFVPRDVGSTRIDLTVTEEALNAAVDRTRGRLRVEYPHFALDPGSIVFTGRIQFLFMKNSLKLAGGLSVHDGSRVSFHPSRVKVASIALPGFLVQALERRFNPVLDLGRAAFWKKFRAHLAAIDIEDGALRVRTDPAPGDPFVPEADDAAPPAVAGGGAAPEEEVRTVLNSTIDPSRLD